MNKTEVKNLKEGDMVIITAPGLNKGKMGIVREIYRTDVGTGKAYLEPYQCEFEFENDLPRSRNKDGLYGWNYYNLMIPRFNLLPKLKGENYYE